MNGVLRLCYIPTLAQAHREFSEGLTSSNQNIRIIQQLQYNSAIVISTQFAPHHLSKNATLTLYLNNAITTMVPFCYCTAPWRIIPSNPILSHQTSVHYCSASTDQGIHSPHLDLTHFPPVFFLVSAIPKSNLTPFHPVLIKLRMFW